MVPLPSIPGYDVEAEVGRGGMGVVYRVRRQATGEVLALKMVLYGRGATFAELARFRVEAEALACLDHPNIVNIRDVGVHAGYPFFTLDFAERGTLRQRTRSGPVPPAEAAAVTRTLALAVQHAHGRGMLHRDLKPANVLVMADGTLKLTDFGLVKFAVPRAVVNRACCTVPNLSDLDWQLARFAEELRAQYSPASDADGQDVEELARDLWRECAARTGLPPDPARVAAVTGFVTAATEQSRAAAPDPVLPGLDDLTQTGAVLGSPQYMAPEQAAGDLRRIGRPTDVYGLGAVLYELLTGRPPFRARDVMELLREVGSQPPTPPRELAPGVPPGLEAVCLRCLEKDPGRRYPTAAALAEALEKFRAKGGSVPADRPPPGGAPTHPEPGQRSTRSWWPFGWKSK